MDDAIKWVEDHPALAAVIGVGGVLVILWLFGFFSSSGNSQGGNLAAAYYNAEAQQATAGAQLQMASIQATAATRINADQVNGQVAIAATNANAAQIINGQNTGSANTIAGYGLQATQSNDAAALAAVISSNQTAATTNYQNNQTMQYADLLHSGIVSQELAATGGYQANFYTPTTGGFALGGAGAPMSITDLMGQGFTSDQATQLVRLQGWSPL